MKKVLLLFLISVILIPIGVFAKETSTNLEKTLLAENISPMFSDYTENENQVVLYLFYSSTCPYCKYLLNYLNSLTSEYGYMFKLRAYEIYKNEDNLKFKNNLTNYLNSNSEGVPFLVIGKESICGFSNSNKEYILNLIQEEYSKDKLDRYDVVEEYYLSVEETKKEKSSLSYYIKRIAKNNYQGTNLLRNLFNLIKNFQ